MIFFLMEIPPLEIRWGVLWGDQKYGTVQI